MPPLRKISGKQCLKILCNKFGFETKRQKGSHVILTKIIPEGKIGTVVSMHEEIKIGTLKSILKLARVSAKKNFLNTFSKFVSLTILLFLLFPLSPKPTKKSQ